MHHDTCNWNCICIEGRAFFQSMCWWGSYKTPFNVSFPWASYQIGKIASCACSGNAGNVFPATDFKRKPLVSDPGIYHGRCVTHVAWCMSWSRTRRDGENVPGILGVCATRNTVYLARGPLTHWYAQSFVFLFMTVYTVNICPDEPLREQIFCCNMSLQQ